MPEAAAKATAAPLRIALLTHSVNPRGGVVHVLELARALHGLGHRVTVFAPAMRGQRLFRPVPHAVELVPAGPAPARLADLVAQRIEEFKRHLINVLEREHFDIFHAHDGIGANALADLAEAGVIDGFVRTGAGPARDRGAAPGAGGQLDLDLDGRVAAGVQNLPRGDVINDAHVRSCGECCECSGSNRHNGGERVFGSPGAADPERTF